MATSVDVRKALLEYQDTIQAINLEWFFKTGDGDYGHGDRFHGLRVPQTRSVAKEFKDLKEVELRKLLKSGFHEERQVALFIMVLQFQKTKDQAERERLFNLYIEVAKRGHVNNWDLVDATAPYFGQYLVDTKDTKILRELAKTKNLWLNRISVILTFAFIRAGIVEPTLEMAEFHLKHQHDLMHKAVGWMLREVGKIDRRALDTFLEIHLRELPRTTLRYAIEKHSESARKAWLAR